MRSWEVRLATTLVWLGVLPGAACLALSYRAFANGDDLLLIVMPLVGSVLLCAGLFVLTAAVELARRLLRARRGARLQTAVLGGGLVGMGVFVMAVVPWLGALFILYGGALIYLMTSPGAAADLGPWRRAFEQPAPWGATPGTGIWAPAPAQPAQHPSVPAGPEQGPWAPDPTTLPWFSWKDHTGPRVPWWQTWEAGLAQGVPLGEALLLGLALLGFLAGLACILVPSLRAFALVAVPASIGVVALLEQRMRRRLAGRR